MCSVPSWKVVVVLRCVLSVFSIHSAFTRWPDELVFYSIVHIGFLSIYVPYSFFLFTLSLSLSIAFLLHYFPPLSLTFYGQTASFSIDESLALVPRICGSLINCALEIRNICGQINGMKGIKWTRRRDNLNAFDYRSKQTRTYSQRKKKMLCDKGASERLNDKSQSSNRVGRNIKSQWKNPSSQSKSLNLR